MNFHQLSELLFNNYLLADSRTLQLVLHRYEKALVNGEEQIGLLKRPAAQRRNQVRVLEGVSVWAGTSISGIISTPQLSARACRAMNSALL